MEITLVQKVHLKYILQLSSQSTALYLAPWTRRLIPYLLTIICVAHIRDSLYETYDIIKLLR